MMRDRSSSIRLWSDSDLVWVAECITMQGGRKMKRNAATIWHINLSCLSFVQAFVSLEKGVEETILEMKRDVRKRTRTRERGERWRREQKNKSIAKINKAGSEAEKRRRWDDKNAAKQLEKLIERYIVAAADKLYLLWWVYPRRKSTISRSASISVNFIAFTPTVARFTTALISFMVFPVKGERCLTPDYAASIVYAYLNRWSRLLTCPIVAAMLRDQSQHSFCVSGLKLIIHHSRQKIIHLSVLLTVVKLILLKLSLQTFRNQALIQTKTRKVVSWNCWIV